LLIISISLVQEKPVRSVSVHWDDLIPHYRLVTLRVENLGPLTVGIDAHGRSLYDSLQDILAELNASRKATATR
jgi:fumarate hydratase subunit beta